MASNAHWLTSGKFVTRHRERELNFVNSQSLTWDYTNLSGAERKYINAFYKITFCDANIWYEHGFIITVISVLFYVD